MLEVGEGGVKHLFLGAPLFIFGNVFVMQVIVGNDKAPPSCVRGLEALQVYNECLFLP